MQAGSPRVGWKAALLSLLLTPGLGHLYAGRPKRGAAFFCVALAAAYTLVALALFDALSAASYGTVLAMLLAVRMASVVDAVRIARSAGSAYQLRRYNRWYAYVGATLVASLLVLPTRLVARPYRIPSGGMLPTVQIGDYIITNSIAYPRTPPARGDVVVFRYPRNRDETYIKRIIGLPGETIAIHQRRVSVNGQEIDDPWGFCPDGRSVGDRAADCGPPIARADEIAPTTVRADEYFVLGDNRMRSQDSRFWGALPKADLLGKVVGVCWSWDAEQLRMRLDRIGLALDRS